MNPNGMQVNKPPLRILIIEDEPIIALDLQDFLVDAGFDVVGIAGKLDKALEMIESVAFDAAVVDANLAGVSAAPAASALTGRSIPFVVLSGYSLEQHLGAFAGPPCLQKPFQPAQLMHALETIAAGRQDRS